MLKNKLLVDSKCTIDLVDLLDMFICIEGLLHLVVKNETATSANRGRHFGAGIPLPHTEHFHWRRSSSPNGDHELV